MLSAYSLQEGMRACGVMHPMLAYNANYGTVGICSTLL